MSTLIPAITPNTPVPTDEVAPPLRILVVEDNSDLCQLVCELLYGFGHIVLPAGSGEEALESLEIGTKFDVLLSDVNLPGISGVELARKVLAVEPGTHIIFASGYGDFLTSNIDFPAHSLTKPYDITYLHQLLATLKPLTHAPTH